MSVYSVKLKSLGEMSQLPDSQKIFGALVYLLLANPEYGPIDDFITCVKKDESTFALSSLLPTLKKDSYDVDGGLYFPVPKSYVERRALEKGDCISTNDQKRFYSELKKCDFMKVEDIEKIIKEPKELFNKTPLSYLRICTEQQVHVNTEEEQKNLIFSVQRIVFKDKKDVSAKPDIFEFFIRCDDDNTIIKLLNEKIKEKHIFTLGKRSSQGYNLFDLKEVKKCHCLKENIGSPAKYLNLGMLLPNLNCVDFTASSLELFTSERRRYDSGSKKWDECKERGHFISFIAPGSVVVLSKDNVETADNFKPINVGKCVPLPADGKGIVFGKSFLYPLEGI